MALELIVTAGLVGLTVFAAVCWFGWDAAEQRAERLKVERDEARQLANDFKFKFAVVRNLPRNGLTLVRGGKAS